MTRLNQITHRLKAEQIDALLIFDANNITYLSGFTGHAATALVLAGQAYLLTDYRYFEQAKDQCSSFNVVCRDRVNQSLAALIQALLEKHAVNKLGFEANHISHGVWVDMMQNWPQVSCLPTVRWIEDLRYIKDQGELQSMQLAANIADQALGELLTRIQPGITERELAIELEHQMALLGSEQPSFSTIMLAAERSALPHGVPGDKALQNGDLLLIDFGAVINGYHSDMTRTFVLGEADAKQKEIYQTVYNAQQAAMDAFNHEVSGEMLYQQAQKVLNQSQYAQYQGEGLGHGVGMDLHEFPFIGQGCELTIKKHCVVTIEPGIYIPGWGGVRIEDDVYLTDNGLQSLTQFPRELIEL
ncbi:M24 family metallopeptidase [Marinicella litoralis]|uniref:Xaa-Pro aminopeptidase/Xaa-Pro dipeptidase n=1 Tax=Marinicella litoralis TaxID=644220 RepID=A0A4R6XSS0_9GAMM|nr:Xaa-Pro peptidase family protein [Marinicella litoralis]TDR20453.1 Xaa-Pro aminopeptidase/Xaa-Pro dipeptidase [Marinicella litoralis]